MFSFLKFFGSRLTAIQRGNQAFTRKQYHKALELYLQHAKDCPDEAAKAYASAGVCHMQFNLLPEPVGAMPGIQLISEGDRKGAEKYFRLALQSDPSNIKALSGLCSLVPESSEERLELLERSVAAQPGTLNLIDLGDFHQSQRNDPDKAYHYYLRAKEHNPKDGSAYVRLAEICRVLGREDEALQWEQSWAEVKQSKRRVDGKSP